MGGRLEGKVALITGAARGQGRSHAVRFAQEGADVVVLDVCAPIDSVGSSYPAATESDLAETVRLVESHGRKARAVVMDVRDRDGMDRATRDGAEALGGLDVVVANAGIFTRGSALSLTPASWREMIDINLTGAWHTARSGIAVMREQGRGGAVVIISSGAGFKGAMNAIHYTAAKHAVVGLARALSSEAAKDFIRVNTLHPTNVDTLMIQNESTWSLFRPDLDHPTRDDAYDGFASINTLPLGWIEPSDVSNALLWLVSDEARYITGIALPVDAGLAIK